MEEYQSLMKAIAILDRLRGQHRVPCHCRVKGMTQPAPLRTCEITLQSVRWRSTTNG